MTNDSFFEKVFHALTGNQPFPWQRELYRLLSTGQIPSSCNIPTGLGKTSVIPIWLIALAAAGTIVPRRLVYVVNRRTVVDQATDEAKNIRDGMPAELTEKLRKLCAEPTDIPLVISTLRGQYAGNNREWSADPSRPAIIVGTVDMIGSRLLFSGYGVGFKTKPLHAGFLGQDVLLVHDEAHLEPAFQKLLTEIKHEQIRSGDHRPFHVMELSATSRGGDVFGLTDEDRSISEVKKRIEAKKSIQFHENENRSDLPDRLAELALQHENANCAVLVFARAVETVEKVAEKLRKVNPGVETLTGTLRGKERDSLVEKPVFKRFRPKAASGDRTVYLVCTSAGEVGINISADHMVCELSTFESMAQRFGRVNRFGDRADTRIDVLYPTVWDENDKLTPYLQRTLDLLRKLDGDGSPEALRCKLDSFERERRAAFSPDPDIVETSDILFDAWALTSVREKILGRPPVDEFLHGRSEWEPPQTYVAWREDVGMIVGPLLDQYQPKDLLEDYPIKPHELLRDRSDRVFTRLASLAKKRPNTPVWLLDGDGTVEFGTIETPLTLEQVADKDERDRINGRTVLLPPELGGLRNGLLVGDSDGADDVADEWYEGTNETERRRLRIRSDDPTPESINGMRLMREIDTRPDDDERESTVEVEEPEDSEQSQKKGRYWRWYVRPRSADDDGSKTSLRPVTWDDHTDQVTKLASAIAAVLDLEPGLQKAIYAAARHHDDGKKRVIWQRGIGNPNPTDWHAKSGKGWKLTEFSPYRHEFGSLLDLELSPDFQGLDLDQKDLVRHIIAAHHGRGRPHFPPDEAFDNDHPQPEASRTAAEVPGRFARLQRKYGRWGLAYLESILRAADYAASAVPLHTDGSPSEADKS
jgi:CRISPR-associated endonuclease/helicase Cas3